MSARRRVAHRLAGLLGDLIVLGVLVAARGLAPWKIGRLLQSVSLPRFRDHRLRTSLTVLGIALGVAMLVAVVLVNRSIVRSVTGTLDDVGGRADLCVTGGASGFDEAVLDAVLETPGVAHATPVLEQTTLLGEPGAEGEWLLVLGVDMIGDEDEQFRTYESKDLDAIKEDPILFLNSRSNLIVTRKLADRFDLALHDRLRLGTPRGVEPFEAWGIIEDTGVGRAFGGFVAVMYYQAMQVAFARGSNVDRIDVAVAAGEQVEEVAAQLVARLGPGLAVERPERKTDRMLKMLVALRTGLTVGSLVALLVGMFLIYNTMAISVVQRRRELGILRALGITRGQILRLITLEGLLFGLVGSIGGVGLGVVLAHLMLRGTGRAVSELYLQVSVTEIELDPGLVALGLGLGLFAAVVSSLVPAREATRVQPVETLRTGPVVPRALEHRRFGLPDLLALLLFGLSAALLRAPPLGGLPLAAYGACLTLLLGAALLAPRVIALVHRVATPLLGRLLGVEARLASDNLRRDLGRASVTVAALMVGVAMTIAVAIFVGSFVRSTLEWVDQSIPADLHLTSASRFGGVQSMPMEDLLTGPLSEIPGVALVERVRIADLAYAGYPIKLLSTDMEVFVQRARLMMFEGDEREAVAGVRRGEVLVSENMSRRLDLHPGGEMELSTRTGAKRYRIAGVLVDYTSDMGTIFVDRPVYVRDFGDSRVDTYKLYLTPDGNIDEVRSTVSRRFGARYNLFVLTYQEFKQGIVDLLEQVFSIMRALELVAILIAVLGVVNALLASVLDRVREIGVLRAIGMRRRQARAMVVVEGGLVGLCSVLLGLGAGAVLGRVLLEAINLVQTGWYFPYRPPWLEILHACGAVLAVSLAAGYYPARAAAALDVVEALEYE